MPTFRSFGEFNAALGRMARDLDGAERRRINADLAAQAQKIAEQEASRDLGGDPKFSGWAPPLDTAVKTVRGGAALLKPTRYSAGPWTVAERGRNQGNGGGGAFFGPGANRKTGATSFTKTGKVRVRRFKSKRWNGRTAGKGTASRSVVRMDRELPPIAGKRARLVMQKHFDVT